MILYSDTATADGVTTVISTPVSPDSYLWNCPVCSICHRGYIGTHTCNPDDLRDIIARLEAKIAEVEQS